MEKRILIFSLVFVSIILFLGLLLFFIYYRTNVISGNLINTPEEANKSYLLYSQGEQGRLTSGFLSDANFSTSNFDANNLLSLNNNRSSINGDEFQGYIIEFSEQPLVMKELASGDGMKKANILSNEEDLILSQHRDLLNKLGYDSKSTTSSGTSQPRPIVFAEYSYIFNGLALNVSPSQLELIKEQPYVKEVYKNSQFNITLDNSVPFIGANDVWNLQDSNGNKITGKNITIAIIDTGIDYTQPDLGGCFGVGCKVIGGYDFVNNDSDPMDDYGHGTHVAGIAAGNGVLKGVAPDAKILDYKVCNSNGGCLEDDILSGIERAVEDNASIISMSLGGSGTPDDPLSQATNNAVSAGVVTVVAAGNSGPNSFSIGSPGTARNAITVGASFNDIGRSSLLYVNGAFFDSLGIVKSKIGNVSNVELKKISGFGNSTDFQMGGNLTGKIAFVNVGLISSTKIASVINNAKNVGAIGVILYTPIYNSANLYKYEIANYTDMFAALIPSANPVGLINLTNSTNPVFVNLTVSKNINYPYKIAPFSSVGPTTSLTVKPDISAPGVGICSSELGTVSNSSLCFDNRHVSLSGTSMATPHIAGVVALIKQAHPDWTPGEIKMAIRDTAMDIGLNYTIQGWGIVNASAAVDLAEPPCFAQVDVNELTAGYPPWHNILNINDGIINITGSAVCRGGMNSWVLEYGDGFDPSNWTMLTSSTSEVSSGLLGSVNTRSLGFGEFALRLLVNSSSGLISEDRTDFAIFSECWDGSDNDGDSLIDSQDPGCWTDPNNKSTYNPNLDNESLATTQCQDGYDNNGNGLADFPDDPACLSPLSNNEVGEPYFYYPINESNINFTDVCTPQDLKNIQSNLNGNYRLICDINASGLDWVPLGFQSTFQDYPQFTGIFNGQGHTIYNLTIKEKGNINLTNNYSGFYPMPCCEGLFGASNGTIENLNLVNINYNLSEPFTVVYNDGFSVDSYNMFFTGGLVGFFKHGGIIKNVHISGDIYLVNDMYVGGLVGGNMGVIQNSSSSVNMHPNPKYGPGPSSLGGLAGVNGYLINNSESNGKIDSGSIGVGGLVGANDISYYTDPVSSSTVYLYPVIINSRSLANIAGGISDCGGLVGEGYPIIVKNSYANGNISGCLTNIGGLVGDMEPPYGFGGTSEIVNSSSSGFVSGGAGVGGLVGSTTNGGGYPFYKLKIINSYSNSTIIGNNSVGGLLGYASENSVIEKSYSNGKVLSLANNYTNNCSFIAVGPCTGGLVGEAINSVINDSYSLSNITSLNMSACAGGLLGMISNNTYIRNSYSAGSVNSSDFSSGGFIGINCTNDNNVINSYFDMNTSNRSSDKFGFGRTTQEMKENSTFVNWDFDNIWDIKGNYPFLRPYVFQKSPFCGDLLCNGGETCLTCSLDCGQCSSLGSSSSGGGGGSGISVNLEKLNVYFISNPELIHGITDYFVSDSTIIVEAHKTASRASFTYLNYSIAISNVLSNSAILSVQGTSIVLILNMGEEKLLNLGPGYDPIYVTLNSIDNGKVSLTIKSVESPKANAGNSPVSALLDVGNYNPRILLILIIILTLLVLVSAFFVIYFARRINNVNKQLAEKKNISPETNLFKTDTLRDNLG